MNFLLDVAKESVVALAEQSPEGCGMASGWLKVKDRARWDRIADGIFSHIITDRGDICVNDAAQQFRDQVWQEARNLWVSQLSQEHFDATMALFGDGVIDGFQTPYGEVLDCFEFDFLWDEHHKGDDMAKDFVVAQCQ